MADKSGNERKLLLAPRRLGETSLAAIRSRYFPGLEVPLDGDTAEGLFQALEDSDFDGLEQGAYALVVMVEALEHSSSPADLLAAAAGAMATDAALVVSVPLAMPPHEAGTDYWRMTTDGLSLLLKDAGFEEVQVFDTGEEVVWDILPEAPGMVEAWMPYPRTCFATAKKGSAPAREPDREREAAAARELIAQDVDAMKASVDDLTACLKVSGEREKRYQERIRALEQDNVDLSDELVKAGEWARGMESQLIELREEIASNEDKTDSSTPAPVQRKRRLKK
jgi:hypothetical protein